METRPSVFRVRWVIFSFLFMFGFVAYVQRISLSIAAAQMMPQLGLSQIQIGALLTAFNIGYTAFQLPGGLFGQRVGACRALLIVGLVAFIATMITPLAPAMLTGSALMAVLLASRFVVGVAQAPVFPVSAGLIERWFPVGKWAFPNGLQVTGLGLGAAVTPPLIAELMSRYGWVDALLWTGIPALGLLALWWWIGRDAPALHAGVSAQELAELKDNGPAVAPTGISWAQMLRVLKDRNIALLSLSYLLMNYLFYLLSFWCFLYLIQVRHFTILESGWLAMAPFLVAAAGGGIGGRWTDHLVARHGARWGFRLIPLVALPSAAALLLLAVKAGNPYVAVVALSLCFGCIELTEGPFWAATMHIARRNSMAATGVLNTGGNLGGIIGTALVAVFSAQHDWVLVFTIGTVLGLASAALWIWIDADRPLTGEDPHGVQAAEA